jgi:hypothetical protein
MYRYLLQEPARSIRLIPTITKLTSVGVIPEIRSA